MNLQDNIYHSIPKPIFLSLGMTVVTSSSFNLSPISLALRSYGKEGISFTNSLLYQGWEIQTELDHHQHKTPYKRVLFSFIINSILTANLGSLSDYWFVFQYVIFAICFLVTL